ncbi:MAG: ATPase [Tissierellia bacterium]|nr:ATPase [Tissierellia bacterium]
MMNNLEEKINLLKKHFYTENAKKEMFLEQEKIYDREVQSLLDEVDVLEKVLILFQHTSQYAREQGKIQIENLTTKSLRYIFDKDYKFEIDITEKRNASSAEFYVVEENENGKVKIKPEISKGGGIVDIVSLALRLSFLENSKPKIEGPLILDEPAKHVSEEFTFDIGEFLLQFSDQMNRQIIMITHNQHLASLSKNVYRVTQEGGISNVERSMD